MAYDCCDCDLCDPTDPAYDRYWHETQGRNAHQEPCDDCEQSTSPQITSEWEPLYRAEKRRADAAEAKLAEVRTLADVPACPDGGMDCHCDCLDAFEIRFIVDAP